MALEPHPTRTEYVVQALRERILKGQVAGGDPIRQIALAKELGVSQIPVREALLRLAAEGLVDFIPHRGAVATRLTEAEIRELSHLRALVETDLLRSAVPRLTAAHIDAAQETLAQFESLLDKRSDIEHWSKLNHRFHASIYEAAECPVSLELVASLHLKSDRYIRLQLLLTDWIPQAQAEHRELLDLCCNGRTDKACSLLERHIREAGRAIANLLADQANSPDR
jgi:DNA-binding GntR family transcriptional regulator